MQLSDKSSVTSERLRSAKIRLQQFCCFCCRSRTRTLQHRIFARLLKRCSLFLQRSSGRECRCKLGVALRIAGGRSVKLQFESVRCLFVFIAQQLQLPDF